MTDERIVTMIWFCDHTETGTLSQFLPLHHSVKIKEDGTCHRMRRCLSCVEKILKEQNEPAFGL